jgi:hypothetical protein
LSQAQHPADFLLPPSAIVIPVPQTKRVHAVVDIAERGVSALVNAPLAPLALKSGVTRNLQPATDTDGLIT